MQIRSIATSPRGRRGALTAGAVALLLAGAAGGASAVSLTRPSVDMASSTPVPISSLSAGSGLVSLHGQVTERYGDQFILQDQSGHTLVDTGPRASVPAVGSPLTVQGRFDRGAFHARFLVDAADRIQEVGPPPPPPHGGPAGGPRGPGVGPGAPPPPPPGVGPGAPPPPPPGVGPDAPPPPPPGVGPGAPPPPPGVGPGAPPPPPPGVGPGAPPPPAPGGAAGIAVPPPGAAQGVAVPPPAGAQGVPPAGGPGVAPQPGVGGVGPATPPEAPTVPNGG